MFLHTPIARDSLFYLEAVSNLTLFYCLVCILFTQSCIHHLVAYRDEKSSFNCLLPLNSSCGYVKLIIEKVLANSYVIIEYHVTKVFHDFPLILSFAFLVVKKDIQFLSLALLNPSTVLNKS